MITPAVTNDASPAGRVAIFGPGLIGGSIAMALRSRSPATVIATWARSDTALQELSDRGLADATFTDPKAAVQGADLVVLCTPVTSMKELSLDFAPFLKDSAIVTDAGSVKASVVNQLSPILGKKFVGAHPMAGSERSGLGAAREDLFAGAPCLITPTEVNDSETVKRTTAFWTSLGTVITTMSPEHHDRLVARISHLPHALAYAFVNLIAESLPEGSALLAGGSFREITRVAASAPSLWNGILMENRSEVASALRDMSAELLALATDLDQEKADSLLDFLQRAKHHRDSFPFPTPRERVTASQ